MALFQAASSTAFSVIPIATAHISLAGNFIDAVANPLRLFRLREDAVESGFQGSRDGPCFGASALDSRKQGPSREPWNPLSTDGPCFRESRALAASRFLLAELPHRPSSRQNPSEACSP